LAKELLNPERSVLIVTIDEKEYLRLGLLLEQIFPTARIQMVSITINPKGTSRPDMFSRVDEFGFFVLLGDAKVPAVRDQAKSGKPVRWRYLRREDDASKRGTRPRQFYPVFVDPSVPKVVGVGDPLPHAASRNRVVAPPGQVAVFGVRESDGQEMEWGLTGPTLLKAATEGYVRATPGNDQQPFIISYLTAPNARKVENGELRVTGVRPDGSKVVVAPEGPLSRPKTVWQESRHSAGDYGTKMLGEILPGRRFPFPKSLYAVEDTLQFFVADNPEAVVIDFFSGSGTTAHAVMRLNRQYGGQRQSIVVTNNEVSAAEAETLRKQGFRPGDPEWESLGIFEHITRPRVTTAITGRTPDGEPVKGDYKFTDQFPMAEGFEENVEFVELTYQDPDDIELDLAFEAIATLLWLRAGGVGAVIDQCLDSSGKRKPYAWTDQYGVLFNADRWRTFVEKLPATATTVFVVTDSPATFAGIAAEFADHIDVVRLYENYLTTFRINEGHG
jgi:adenine-specific DNA-methyltransferase